MSPPEQGCLFQFIFQRIEGLNCTGLIKITAWGTANTDRTDRFIANPDRNATS
ncbi:hypothetical protein D9M68_950200 [compost metagenome]